MASSTRGGGTGELVASTRPACAHDVAALGWAVVRLAVARFVGFGTDDISDAVEKMMAEKVARHLPSDSRVDPNVFRDDVLYTYEAEAIFRGDIVIILKRFLLKK